MPQADQDPWQRLAHAVTTRRTALGLTQAQVAAAGGPSAGTMRLIEGALQNNYRDSILGRLERALLWAPGSVNAVLHGGHPAEIGAPHAPTATPTTPLDDELQAIADNSRNPALRQWAASLLRDVHQLREVARDEQAG